MVTRKQANVNALWISRIVIGWLASAPALWIVQYAAEASARGAIVAVQLATGDRPLTAHVKADYVVRLPEAPARPQPPNQLERR